MGWGMDRAQRALSPPREFSMEAVRLQRMGGVPKEWTFWGTAGFSGNLE